MSPDLAISIVASKQFGVFTCEQALGAGFTYDSIRRRCGTGRWVVLYRGVYSLAGTPPSPEREVFAAVAAYGPTAIASSVTAGWLLDVADPQTRIVHITLPGGQRRRSRHGIVTHQAVLRRSDIRTAHGIRVTAPNRTLVDIAGVLPKSRLEDALDRAIFLGLTSLQSLDRYITTRRLGHLRGVGRLRKLMADRAGGVTQSELERVFLRKLRKAGLPDPIRQFPVGRRKIDMCYPGNRLIIELDGHGTRYARRDLQVHERRQNEVVLALPGWTLLRFTRDDVFDDWPYVEVTLREVLQD